MGDDVARLQPGAVARAAFDRRDDLQHRARLLLQFKPDAVVGTGGVLVEIARRFAVEIDAVRVEVEQQATQRGMHQLLVGDGLDVGLADRVVHADEAADLGQRHLAGDAFSAIGIVDGGDVRLLRRLFRGFRPLLRVGGQREHQCEDKGQRAKAHRALLQRRWADYARTSLERMMKLVSGAATPKD